MVNQKAIKLMHEFEGLRLDAYLCPAKIPTIGWGNTRYEDGSRVKIGDKISKERADELFQNIVNDFAENVDRVVKSKLNENQFGALVSFAYNVGVGNLTRSTLLRKVNENPCDPSISDEFMRWNKAGGRVLAGLTRRRKAESELYFSNR